MDHKVKEARTEAWRDLQKMILDVEISMLTTVTSEDCLSSRPMMTQEADDDGVLWFFTHEHHAKAKELADDPRVNVSYSKIEAQKYVSVSGLAELVHDEVKKKKLWKPVYKAWFPDGVDDPHLALLKVYIEKAEYWDTSSSKWLELAGFAKALLTGKGLELDAEMHDTMNFMKNPPSASAAAISN